jgi:hypothetical protein
MLGRKGNSNFFRDHREGEGDRGRLLPTDTEITSMEKQVGHRNALIHKSHVVSCPPCVDCTNPAAFRVRSL